MDGSQFEMLLRGLTSANSRRGAVVGLLGGALGLLGMAESEAKHKHKKKKKKKGGSPPSPPSLPSPPSPPAGCTADAECAGNTPFCRSGACVACSASVPCPQGQCCTASGGCGACTVFVSSTGQLGSFLPGLTGADAVCQDLAGAAGLPGDYLAWLSDTTGSPSSRFIRATVPYVLTTGTAIATNWSDLTDGALAHAIDRTESGALLSLPLHGPWTNTLIDGTAEGLDAASHCGNWDAASTGNTGETLFSDAQWTNFSNHNCNDLRPIYCFQQR